MEWLHRLLCGKLYLKAETQEVDRILEAFSQRYFECNPDTIFGSPGEHLAIEPFAQPNHLLLRRDPHGHRIVFTPEYRSAYRRYYDPYVSITIHTAHIANHRLSPGRFLAHVIYIRVGSRSECKAAFLGTDAQRGYFNGDCDG